MNLVLLSYIEQNQGQRLDAFLAKNYPQLSRRHWRGLCLDGAVRLNSRTTKPGVLLSLKDCISVPRESIFKSKKEGFLDKATLVFEDENVVVINKSPGIHSVSLRSNNEPSIADWIGHYFNSCIEASPSPLESGLINRLDFYTSGLMFAAKNKRAWHEFSSIQKKGACSKEYLALCEGGLKRKGFEIEQNLKQNSDGSKMLKAHRGAKMIEATTQVLDTEIKDNNTCVVTLGGATFVRHQLRAHMESIGHPLVGDLKYGSTSKLENREGFLLHSRVLSFAHPFTHQRMIFEQESEELL